MSVTGLHWWSINIGSGNGLVPYGVTRPQWVNSSRLRYTYICQYPRPSLIPLNYLNQCWLIFNWTLSSNKYNSIKLYFKFKSFHSRQDRRWNADKPSATLDPYIPTWLTTSPANHKPANFWFLFFFFFTFKGICEKWCNLRSNWWASTSNLKFPFSDSFKYK